MKLFVAAMGASSYIFAQARPSEQIADWIGAHVDLFAFLGGPPSITPGCRPASWVSTLARDREGPFF